MKNINGWLWQEYEEVGSTNDTIKDIISSKSGSKYLVTAIKQTAGRGRRGHSWISLKGNLFMSMALEISSKDIGQFVFVVSLSLFDALHQLFPKINISLKWPNDILLNNCKISGILLEKGEGDYLIAGIGVNIAASPQIAEASFPPKSLSDNGFNTDRITLLKSYLNAFDENFSIWKQQGFEKIRQRWLDNAENLQKRILVRMHNEDKIGIFSGIDDDGALLLKCGNFVEKIYAGDIFYIDNKEREN